MVLSYLNAAWARPSQHLPPSKWNYALLYFPAICIRACDGSIWLTCLREWFLALPCAQPWDQTENHSVQFRSTNVPWAYAEVPDLLDRGCTPKLDHIRSQTLSNQGSHIPYPTKHGKIVWCCPIVQGRLFSAHVQETAARWIETWCHSLSCPILGRRAGTKDRQRCCRRRGHICQALLYRRYWPFWREDWYLKQTTEGLRNDTNSETNTNKGKIVLQLSWIKNYWYSV